ncbi:hypothetical protein [Microcystis phage Mwe-JY05]
MTARILVTGSRDWTDPVPVRDALERAVTEFSTVGQPVLVHGAARGLDRLAEQLWRKLADDLRALYDGVDVLADPEPHPALWARYGRRAGPYRNQRMVDAGAVVCLAFPIGLSSGTRDCMARARLAGIPVRVHEGGA